VQKNNLKNSTPSFVIKGLLSQGGTEKGFKLLTRLWSQKFQKRRYNAIIVNLGRTTTIFDFSPNFFMLQKFFCLVTQ